MKQYLSILALTLVCFTSFGKAPTFDSTHKNKEPYVHKFFIRSAMDGFIFSTASVKNTTPYDNSRQMSTLRFTCFLNVGVTFNYNVSKHFGIYTGVDLKNVGFIDYGIKHRTYNLGVPAGIKIGDMRRKRGYFFLGTGADIPVNYKEKIYYHSSDKKKFNEWFSNRTPFIMPYVFAGIAVRGGATLKVQYYLTNYLNQDFTKDGIKPYADYNVHLLLFSLGMPLRISKDKGW